jgi:glutathione S-transferase
MEAEAMAMTFYYTPMTSATRVHWALEELGVPYEKKKVDLSAGEQKTPAYRKLNPNAKVPLLVDDGVPIFESLAILLHLAERYGVDKGLFPAPGLERAQAFKWMAWATASLGDAVGRILRNTSDRFPEAERSAAQGAKAREEAQALLGILDEALAGREYLVGSSFSLADLAVAALLPFAARLGVDATPHKNVTAWLGRCTQRPALARAMQG